VAGAAGLLRRSGLARATLAEVAKAADVPLGNVYYYFKTKDDLVQAVVDAHVGDIAATLGSLERHRDPRERLKAFARLIAQTGPEAALHGCPHGTLCVELNKRDDALVGEAARLMARYVGWAEEQFRLMDRTDGRELALTLIAVVQGGALLSSAFGDPAVLTGRARWLESWIDSLSEAGQPQAVSRDR